MERMSLSEIIRNPDLTLPASDEEYERILNNRPWQEPREGVKCEICRNYEYTWVIRDGDRLYHTCECKAKRDNLKRIRESGLSEQMKRCTFETFETPNRWQKDAKEHVIQFVRDKNRGWLLLSGQPGCGKSHLCTAAAGKFLGAGIETRYMRWVDESTSLKAIVNDEEAYSRKINKLKNCKVLYIDDFLKTQKGKDPTPADVKLAFDLLDYRYCKRKMVTIISTERSIDELLEIDPAVGSRIYEMSKGYRLSFEYSEDKNWRLKS